MLTNNFDDIPCWLLCYMLNTGSASTLVKTQPSLYENMSKVALIQFCSVVFPSTAMFSYSNVTDIMQFIEPHEFLQSYLISNCIKR